MLLFLFIDRSSIEINTRAFFPEKCVPTAAKTMAVDRKKTEGTSFAMFGIGTGSCQMLPTQAMCRASSQRSRTQQR